MAYAWLVPVVLAWHSTVYLAQKHFLVKWFCRNILSKSVVLESDLANGSAINNSTLANAHSNLTNSTTVSNGKGKERNSSRPSWDNRKLITDGDVSKIALE